MGVNDQQRLLGQTIHELAQPCASAVLAVDTALELAHRAGQCELVMRLESAAAALAVLQNKLRRAGEATRRFPPSATLD